LGTHRSVRPLRSRRAGARRLRHRGFLETHRRFAGRGATFLAFVATGALLALFGQTYQTGADVYELFLTWALLGLPLVVAAQWGVASAAWVLVLNISLMLFSGWHPAGGCSGRSSGAFTSSLHT
jgi:uncharacterized membrane protein